LVAIALAAAELTAGRAQQQPVFRGGTDAVIVPVAVHEHGRPVANLTAADFELSDNGVAQQITFTSLEALPIDVTLLLDVSGSLQGPALARFKSDIQKTVDQLQPSDRARLIAFAAAVVEVSPLQPVTARLPLDRLTAAGRTSFAHALAAVLTILPDSERPHLVLVFTDGVDSMSFLDGQQILKLAEYASASMYIALVPGGTRTLGPPSVNIGGRFVGAPPVEVISPFPSRKLLDQAAKATGGAVYSVSSTAPLPVVFGNVLQDFRTGYVLRYSPQGVARRGWHDIGLKLTKRGNFEVHARKGYEGN
jgi:VWFA-related protein